MIETEIPAHLGGFIDGGDEATWFPELWEWIVRLRQAETVLDVGCGQGYSTAFFRDQLGREATGVEGTPQSDPDIVRWDYADGPRETDDRYDLGWSCEFVEHVEERFLPNFLADFARCETLMMTHAEPGQIGHHHVNCRPAAYWIGALAAVGLLLDPWLTETSRALSTANGNPLNHWHRSGLVFRQNR